MDILSNRNESLGVSLSHSIFEIIKFFSGDDGNQHRFFLMIVGAFGIINLGHPSMESLVNLLGHPIRPTGDNRRLHFLLLSENGIRHPAGNKDGHHRIEGILPTKEKTCKNHDNAINGERDAANSTPCLLADVETDNIRSSARNSRPQSIANPRPHDQTTKDSINQGITCQGNLGHDLDKEGTDRYRDEGKNGKAVAQIEPG